MKHALKNKKQKTKNKNKIQEKYWYKHLFPTFVSSIPHQKKIFQTAGIYTFYVAIGLFLFFNIFFSQYISGLFFQLINDDQKASVSYLQSVRNLPQFSSELLRLKNIYGNGLENEVYDKEINESSMIQKYEQLLKKNMNSRDILYSLFLLYDQKGNKKMAQEYLGRARMVDPLIKQ